MNDYWKNIPEGIDILRNSCAIAEMKRTGCSFDEAVERVRATKERLLAKRRTA